jgi:hypothetical protein
MVTHGSTARGMVTCTRTPIRSPNYYARSAGTICPAARAVGGQAAAIEDWLGCAWDWIRTYL